MNWQKNLKGKLRCNEPLKFHTTFKIGGPCRYFIEPKDLADLKLLISSLKSYNIAFRILGAGSNILPKDQASNKAVICLNSSYFKKLSFSGNSVRAGAGVLLNKLILSAAKRGLGGHEFLAGIPGTVGGAIAMNAGKSHESRGIGGLVIYVEVLDNCGNLKRLKRNDLKFGYRSSNLGKFIILSAGLKLKKEKRQDISGKLKDYMDFRRISQDYSLPSAGCVFKNPPSQPAGKLIDLCGLKGKKIGGASVSKKHANFIVNCGNAKSAEVLRLMRLVKNSVKRKFKVGLEPEIRIWR